MPRNRFLCAPSSPLRPVQTCLCCGSNALEFAPVLWKNLIDEWQLAEYEVNYINRQQGRYCTQCNANLRSMALAMAIMKSLAFEGLFEEFVRCPAAQGLRALEINEAGTLTALLSQLPRHVLGVYPEVDMMELPYEDESFDLIVHSDTIEHVPHPVRGLSECLRVLAPGGLCCFTVPIIVDRLTISRTGLRRSYHGCEEQPRADCVVHTEYGADAWKHVVQAGFHECRIYCLEYPTAHALAGLKNR